MFNLIVGEGPSTHAGLYVPVINKSLIPTGS